MANTSGFASALLKSLQVRPFCDDTGGQELTPEEEAALHAFLHEVLASFFRMRMAVPEEKALVILNKRFEQAFSPRTAR